MEKVGNKKVSIVGDFCFAIGSNVVTFATVRMRAKKICPLAIPRSGIVWYRMVLHGIAGEQGKGLY